MLFHSTRGIDKNKTFEEVLLQGLAGDGGLFMPEYWPQIDLKEMKNLDSFVDVAKHIVPLFTKSSFDDDEVMKMLDETWHDFEDKNLLRIRNINNSIDILELFHGPTAAFKDFGLQLAAAFFNKSLKRQAKTAIVFGATSGDTGSAAIDACKKFEAIKSFILIPDGNMSDIQRKQMTTVDQSNVFAILVNGTFDDCQDIVKEGFKTRSFLKKDQYLLAVNSINWVRIIGQICYYFYAALSINKLSKPLNFSIPTGNFGNVFACYSAYKMGMPLEKIVVAVNKNDILQRFFNNNDYSKTKVFETISPSMDISVASNFERLIYDFFLERDENQCSKMYSDFPSKPIQMDESIWKKSQDLFYSYTVNDESTFNCINKFSDQYNYLMDPHTAVAAEAVLNNSNDLKNKTVILSTAHPAKFPNVFEKINKEISHIPNSIRNVLHKKEIANKLNASKKEIFSFIEQNN